MAKSFQISVAMSPNELLRWVVVFRMKDESPIEAQDLDAGYCIDATDAIPLGGVSVVRVPPMREDPIVVGVCFTMRGR